MLPLIASMMAFALVGSITPGPVNIIATSSSARFGLIRTLPHVTGATVGYCLVVIVTGLAMVESHRLLPLISEGMAAAGAAFLLWMAYRIATAPVHDDTRDEHTTKGQVGEEQVGGEQTGKGSTAPRFVDGALVQILNPKAWLWSLSGISLYVAGTDTPARSHPLMLLGLFCLLSFAMCFLGVGTWAVLGHLIRRLLGSARRQKWFNRIMGGILAATTLPLLPDLFS